MRRARIRDQLVLEACLRQRTLERGVVIGGVVLVGAALKRQNRCLDPAGARDRPWRAVAPLARPAVEAHGAGQAVPRGGCEPRLTAAETEADREHLRAAELAKS